MPRGVPASGKRQPRAVFASDSEAETTMAGSALDSADGADETGPEEGFPAKLPADELSFDPSEYDEAEHQAEPALTGEPALTADLALTAAPSVLTAEQREIKELRDQLARVSGRKDIEPVVEELARPGDSSNVVIHFLQDGLTALGRVWYRGEELEFEVGSQAYKDTFDRLGWSWLELRHDEFAQAERWGEIMFRPGPWPGKKYTDGTFEPMKDIRGAGSVAAPTPEELLAAEKRRQKRAAPRLPSLTQS